MIVRKNQFNDTIKRKAEESVGGEFIISTVFKYITSNLWIGSEKIDNETMCVSGDYITKYTIPFLNNGVVIHIQRGYHNREGNEENTRMINDITRGMDNTIRGTIKLDLNSRGISAHMEYLDLTVGRAKEFIEGWTGSNKYEPASDAVSGSLLGDPTVVAYVRNRDISSSDYVYISKLVLVIPKNNFRFINNSVLWSVSNGELI